jgi:hypothetical protein
MRFLAATGMAMILIGCVPAAPAPSSAGSGSLTPDGSAVPATTTCQDIDLRFPDGGQLELTGTWFGNDGSYWTFSQVGECVWATATDRYLAFGAPAYWQVFLRGVLRSDFTLPVEFAYSPLSDVLPSHYGHGVLSIEFGASEGSLTLRKTVGCSGGEEDACPPGEGTLQTTQWTLVSPTVILPPPTPEP